MTKIIQYITFKNVIFFVFIAFLDNRFESLVLNKSISVIEILEYSIFYILPILSYIIISIFMFTLPLYYAFESNKIYIKIPLLVILLLIEYIIYMKLGSNQELCNYNSIISVIFLVISIFNYSKNDS